MILALEVGAVVPAGGVAGLVLALLTLQVRWNNDQRRNEQSMRKEFNNERDALRKACVADRAEDRAEIAELKAEVKQLRDRIDGMR